MRWHLYQPAIVAPSAVYLGDLRAGRPHRWKQPAGILAGAARDPGAARKRDARKIMSTRRPQPQMPDPTILKARKLIDELEPGWTSWKSMRDRSRCAERLRPFLRDATGNKLPRGRWRARNRAYIASGSRWWVGAAARYNGDGGRLKSVGMPLGKIAAESFLIFLRRWACSVGCLSALVDGDGVALVGGHQSSRLAGRWARHPRLATDV